MKRIFSLSLVFLIFGCVGQSREERCQKSFEELKSLTLALFVKEFQDEGPFALVIGLPITKNIINSQQYEFNSECVKLNSIQFNRFMKEAKKSIMDGENIFIIEE